jgi:hypothetical protein
MRDFTPPTPEEYLAGPAWRIVFFARCRVCGTGLRELIVVDPDCPSTVDAVASRAVWARVGVVCGCGRVLPDASALRKQIARALAREGLADPDFGHTFRVHV